MNSLERLYSPPEIGGPGKREARSRRRDLVLAGLFVLSMAALAAATFAILMPGLLGGAYRLHAYFADASGLYTSTQVLQGGYVVGLVERMTPIFPGRDEEAKNCPSPPMIRRPRISAAHRALLSVAGRRPRSGRRRHF